MHLLFYDSEAARAPVDLDGSCVLRGLSQDVQPPPSRIAEEGIPYILDDNGYRLTFFEDFFRYLRTDGVSLKSTRSYARDLVVFARYMDQKLGKSMLDASSKDVGEYRIIRLEGAEGFRLKGSSWRRASVALTRFYQWAADDEAGLIRKAPKTRFRRDGVHNDDSIKFISIDNYLSFRARLAEASAANALRNSAFAELLINSGLRLEEANSLLIDELPYSGSGSFSGKNIVMLSIPETITKGRKARQVPFSRRVAREYIEPYIREERAAAVDRWRNSGGAGRIDRALVGWPIGDGRIALYGHRIPVRASSFTISDRRRLILVPCEGAPLSAAAPALLWLNGQGTPCAASCWSSVFRRTSRALSSPELQISISPHTLRHTFAVQWLTKLISIQVSDPRQADDGARLAHLYRKVSRDPLRTIQRWLGHSSYLTTQKYLTYVDDAIEDIERAAIMFEGELTIDRSDSSHE